MGITYSEFVFVALVIQHAKCVHCIMSSVACLAVERFSSFSLTPWCSEEVTEHTMCVLIFSTTLKHFSF